MARCWRWVPWSVLVASSAVGVGGDVSDVPLETIEKATRSAVLIKVDRVWRGEEFTSCGSGFFVHPDGYILTNWHVIANQIEFYEDEDHPHEISTRVLAIHAVLASGTPREKVLPARVESRDRTRDLALVSVDAKAHDWLVVARDPHLKVTDPVWVVGFPFGDFLSFERFREPTSEANPEVSVNNGRITSLRQGSDDTLQAIQTDAAVNPGNSGGPLLGAGGEVVGVVFAKFARGEGLGYAVPPGAVRSFLDERAYKVSFEPPAIHPSLAGLTVTIDPLLADMEDLTGQCTVEGGDLPRSYGTFLRAGPLLQARVGLASRLPGVGMPEFYVVSLSFARGGVATGARRQFRLPSTAGDITVGTQRDPASTLDDRRYLANRTDISQYAQQHKGSGQSLADAAKGIQLEKSESGSLVIDNNSVEAIGGLDISGPKYEGLSSRALRETAYLFDQVQQEYCMNRGRNRSDVMDLPGFRGGGYQPPTRQDIIDYLFREYGRRTVADYLAALQNAGSEYAEGLQRAGAFRCKDGTWRIGGTYECRPPRLEDCP